MYGQAWVAHEHEIGSVAPRSPRLNPQVLSFTSKAMDPTQQKALNALESYTLLSKSATSPRAAVDLITQAISAPNTYVFAELLQTPNIQALRSAAPEHACYLTLLEIFAWGTWSDYQGSPLSIAVFSLFLLHSSLMMVIQKLRIFPRSLTPKPKNCANSPSSPSPPRLPP